MYAKNFRLLDIFCPLSGCGAGLASPNYFTSAMRVGYLTLLVALVGGCGNGQQPSEVQLDTTTSDEEEQPVINAGPEGDSALVFSGMDYPLDVAIGDVQGRQGGHYMVSFTLTNGTVAVESVTVNGEQQDRLVPLQGTALVQADVFSTGDNLVYSAYAFVATDGSSLAIPPNAGYFTNAIVGVDSNHDGTVGEDERRHVIDGVVDFAGSLPSDIVLSFAMTLDSGESVTGEYTGLFDFTFR